MRIYRGEGGLVEWDEDKPPPPGYIGVLDVRNDIHTAVATKEKPGRPTGISLLNRGSSARALKFWRRFHQSEMRVVMQETEVEKAEKAMQVLLQAFGRYPTRAELQMMRRLMQAQHGEGLPGIYQVDMAARVAKFLNHIPRTFLDLLGTPKATPKVLVESDDEIYDMEAVQAGVLELHYRERHLPKMIRMEMRARRALTKWQWLRALEQETEDPQVQFLVDSSGSMRGDKIALAVAAAMRLAELAGKSPTMRFVAEELGPVLSPEEAVAYNPESLGGGDRFGKCLTQTVAECPEVRDFVVISDFEIKTDGAWVGPGQRMHAVKINSNSGCEWLEKAHSRHDFTPVLRKGGET